MNNNLGILNNRFHKKALENRTRNASMDATRDKKKTSKKKNEYYERWLTDRLEKEKIGSESNLEEVTPQTPKAQIPIKLEVKLIRDIIRKNIK